MGSFSKVVFSDEYKRRFPTKTSRKHDRIGVGYQTPGFWMVMWNGCTTFQAFAKEYIRTVDEEPAE